MYRLYDSSTTFLDRRSLRFVYRLSDSTKIVDLITKIAEDMSVSSRKWEFHQVSSSLRRHLQPHESLPLQLLGLTNRGAPRQRNGLLLLR